MLCLTAHALFAASEPISGTVVDEVGSPLEFANVTLLTLNDSTLVDGTVTDAAGKFSVTDTTNPCFLRISAMGYEESKITNPHGNLGSIQLTPASYELGEVVVKGSRPVAKLKTDGLQVAISGTYLANTGTALDVLGKMPFVSKTGSQLEVLGKGTPIVYINGRQVRDQSELDQLSSTDIKSVDVVTSPGARYDSSVNAVIRITTVAPVGEGFSFNDRTTIGYKHYAYLFEQANFNFRKNGFDLFGMLNYENYRERPRFDNHETQCLPAGTIEKSSFGKDFTKYPIYEGKVGLNYNSSNQYAGFYYDFAYRPAIGNSHSFTSRLLYSVLEDELEYDGTFHKRDRQHLLSTYYTGALGKWRLSANFDAMWQINNRATHETERSPFNSERNYSTDNNVDNRLLAGNITASLSIWKGELSFGAEISDVLRRDLYLANVDFITENDTKIKETTSALFAEMSQTFGKLAVSAGLRWEYTDSRYFLWGERKDDQSRRYHNLAPSASISLPIGNVTTNLSYMRKTSRPAFAQLSSAVRYLDRYSYESGNPNLKPIYRDFVSLSGAWRDIVVELTYCSTKNYFMWQTTPYPGNQDATLLRIENMPRFNTFEAFANYSPCFFSIWRPTFMAGIMAQDFSLLHNGVEIKLNKPLGVFRFNNAIHLPWDIWLNVDLSARTSGNGDNLYIESRWNCDLGLYKSFANDTWSVKLQLNDVFNTYRQQMTQYDALSRASVKKIYDTRDLSLTIRYNFNAARSRYKGRGVANAEKDRF